MKRLVVALAICTFLITGCTMTGEKAMHVSPIPQAGTNSSANPPSPTNSESPVSSSSPESQFSLLNNVNVTEDKTAYISEYHPIVMKWSGLVKGGFLIGGYNQKWLRDNELAPFIQGNEEYKLYNINAYLGEGIGGKVAPHQPGTGPDTHEIVIDSSLSNKEAVLAVSCPWNPMPKFPFQQDNSSETYVNIVSKILEENGLHNVPVNIVQNYRIDLDSDGQDEVLLYAQNMEPISATKKKNTYSVLILRKIINGQVENIYLEKAICLKDTAFGAGCPYVRHIEAIADLNGDGIMEIVVRYLYYEGFGYEIHEIKNNQDKVVLNTIYGGK